MLGILLLYSLTQFLMVFRRFADSHPPSSTGVWVTAIIAFLVIPDLVNVAFGLKWGRWPQVVVIVIAALAALLDRLRYETFYGPTSGLFVYIVIVWFLGYTSLSFLLQAIAGTRGCEMRAIPNLLARIAGRETEQHRCRVGLTRFDQWEERMRAHRPDARAKDHQTDVRGSKPRGLAHK